MSFLDICIRVPNQIVKFQKGLERVGDSRCQLVHVQVKIWLLWSETCLDEAVEHIAQNIHVAKNAQPLTYQHMLLGGKTTFVTELFDKLKREGNFYPLCFNLRRTNLIQGETPRQAIVRGMTMPIMDMPDGKPCNILVDEKALLEHIEETRDGKPWVLIVDDLDAFQTYDTPLDSGMAQLLASILDGKDSFLVYTSSIPIRWEKTPTVDASGGNDERDVKMLPMPNEQNIEKMSKMFADLPNPPTLTMGKLMYHGFVPSLIWSAYSGTSKTPEEAFKERMGV